MVKRIFAVLLLAYICYSAFIYAYGAEGGAKPTADAVAGQSVWQSKNCQACHQLYGLGGYMGPDLTNIISDTIKGPVYAEAFIRSGTARMPNFHLSDQEVKELVAFLTWVDKSGKSRVPAENVTWYGSYKIDKQ